MARREWSVEASAAGERLDRHISAHLDLPRNRVQHWIRDGSVRVNGEPAKTSYALHAGDRVTCEPPPPSSDDLEPEAGALDVLYEDESIVVLNKPAGLVVHPGAGHDSGTLVHRLLAHYPNIEGVGGAGRPGIVHRLDKDTTGALVVALTDQAYRRLSRAFSRRQVDKRYLAIAYGDPGSEERLVEAPVGRHPTRRKEMTVRPDGRPATSRIRRLATGAGISLLEISLESGRTHQIRVHLKYIHHPLVGDPVYGESRWKSLDPAVRGPLRDFPRPALHAWRLRFEHPLREQALAIEAPLPEDLRRLWSATTSTPFPELPPFPTAPID